MEHEINLVTNCLDEQGIEWTIDDKKITTKHQAGNVSFYLVGHLEDNFPHCLPSFHLKDRLKYGSLAHVGWQTDKEWAPVCIGHTDSLSCNYDAPGKLYLSALELAAEKVSNAITDQEYNENELMREFAGSWSFCTKNNLHPLVCLAPVSKGISELIIRSEVKKSEIGLDACMIALPVTEHECNPQYSFIANSEKTKRQNQHKSVLLEITTLNLPPEPNEEIASWWKKQLLQLPDSYQSELSKKSRKTRCKSFIIVCHAPVESGTVWFALKCETNQKRRVPLRIDELDYWSFQAWNVEAHNKEALLPRGGGEISLQDKSVLLVGCGSIGGHVSHQLASAGVGKIELVDPDVFGIENIYRHVSTPYGYRLPKTTWLKNELEYKYPYLIVNIIDPKTTPKLLDLRDETLINRYDLVIVATGAPTDERAFNDFLVTKAVTIPVIYSWVEGFGVGGHAVLVEPASQGCLSCCYIDNTSGLPGLHSTINFITPNQSLVRNLGGCGTQFLPYSNLDATQSALIASRLAIKSLKEEITKGVYVSWKGVSDYVDHAGIKLTHRFYRFNKTLIEMPLYREECNVCAK